MPSMNIMIVLLDYFPVLFLPCHRVRDYPMPRQEALEDAFRQACLGLKYQLTSILCMTVIWFLVHTVVYYSK